MNRYQRVVVAIFLAGLVFALANATLTFSFSRARTSHQTRYSDATRSVEGATRVLPGKRVFLHVEQREGLGSVLASAVRRQLQDVCGFTVMLVNNDPEAGDFPLVLIAVRDDKTFWTPFYAGGSVKVFGKFASNTSHIEVDTTAAVFKEDGAGQGIVPLVVSLDATVENSTVGLVSLSAFRESLLDGVARDFAEHIKKTIDETEAAYKTK